MPDISHTLVAKSDQINAGDLAQPITVTVTGVRVTSEDQPVTVEITGHKPWRPCKGMRRLLARVWGTNTDTWIGHRVTLYNDESATWGGEAVGGIRVSAMSGVPRQFGYVMRTSKKGTKRYEIAPLERGPNPADARAKFIEYASGKGVTVEQVEAFLATHGTTLADQGPENLRKLAADIDAVKAHAAQAGSDDGSGEWDDAGGGES